jgi:1-acyl-sn-glycerol-3-phosphate acyltransferase
MLQRLWYMFCQAIVQALFMALFRGRALHRERVPAEGGLLVVCNHQSFLDPILAALPIRRPFSPMARDSLFRNPAFSWLIRSLYAFPVKRGKADLGAIKEAIRRLKAGRIVLVFPEGTRTRDGSIGKLHAGMVVMAQRAKVPILPMVIDGAFEAWPRGRALPTLHPISVGYGEPIPPQEARSARPEDLARRLRDEMVVLQKELRRRGNA